MLPNRTPQSDQPDRRKTGRLALCGETSCQFGTLSDLSKGGCKVRSKKPLKIPENATVNLKLQCTGATMLVPARPISNTKNSDGWYSICFQFHFTDSDMEQRILAFARTARTGVEYKLRPTG